MYRRSGMSAGQFSLTVALILLLQVSNIDVIKPTTGLKVTTPPSRLGDEYGPLTVPGKRE